MKMNAQRRLRLVAALVLLCMALQVCAVPAFADDPDLRTLLPGQWLGDREAEDPDVPGQKEYIMLTLAEDGVMVLRCNDAQGEYAYSYDGLWSFDPASEDTEYRDLVTLRFESTDNPLYDGQDYERTFTYPVYTESWVENDTEITYLIFEDTETSESSPFMDMQDANGAALYKKKGPNMRVVNCKQYVSLREKRASSSKRLAKVPLGAQVLAYPDSVENGYILCVYKDQYGYILSEYLEAID